MGSENQGEKGYSLAREQNKEVGIQKSVETNECDGGGDDEWWL